MISAMSVHRNVEFHDRTRPYRQIGERKTDGGIVSDLLHAVYQDAADDERRARGDRIGEKEICLQKRARVGYRV